MANSTSLVIENNNQLENGDVQQTFTVVLVNSSGSVTENQLEDGSIHFSDASKVQENEPTCKTQSCKKRKVKFEVSS